ncbi:MAG: hypothetical protein KDC53_00630, partial [Saprospiraceae bacterium]|nr:hypothetical protein [Saprospiraceae bacterium]
MNDQRKSHLNFVLQALFLLFGSLLVLGQSAIKHPLVQSELNKIINNPTKSLRYLDDQFIEIKNNIDGSTQTFSLQINELDS